MITREEFEAIKSFHKQHNQLEYARTKILFESKENEALNNYDIFLSYSSKDKDDAIYLLSILRSKGFKVYVDFEDQTLDPNKVTRATAIRLASIIKKCSLTLYLHSTNSGLSKWCPWELGFTEGANRKGAFMTIQEGVSVSGQEYISLYPSIKIQRTNNDFNFVLQPFNFNTTITLRQYINN